MKGFFRKKKKTIPKNKVQRTKNVNLPVLYITDTLLLETGKLLASFADKKRSEGIVYWFGLELEEISVVTSLIVPDADTSWGCIYTSPEANAEALGVIVGTPVILLGQAHSHPGNKVRHSDIDDQQTFARFEGAISVVVPYFAKKGTSLGRCGIHRYLDGLFQLISPRQIANHIVVIPGKADFRRDSESFNNQQILGEK